MMGVFYPSEIGVIVPTKWGNLLKLDLKGKACRKWVNELEIQGSEKNLDPMGGSAPVLGHYTCTCI